MKGRYKNRFSGKLATVTKYDPKTGMVDYTKDEPNVSFDSIEREPLKIWDFSKHERIFNKQYKKVKS